MLPSAFTAPYDPAAPPPLPGPFPRIARAEPVRLPVPAAEAWTVLADLDRYPAWCPFTRRIETDGRPGSPVRLHLRWDGLLAEPTALQVERVSAWVPGRALAWHLRWPAGSLKAERTQWLENHPDGTCTYHNYDRFNGWLAPMVMMLYGKRITKQFNRVGAALAGRLKTA